MKMFQKSPQTSILTVIARVLALPLLLLTNPNIDPQWKNNVSAILVTCCGLGFAGFLAFLPFLPASPVWGTLVGYGVSVAAISWMRTP